MMTDATRQTYRRLPYFAARIQPASAYVHRTNRYRSNRYLSNDLTGTTYVTTEQVLIAWSAANGFCCLPKSVHPDRIKENLAAASLELMPEVRIVAV